MIKVIGTILFIMGLISAISYAIFAVGVTHDTLTTTQKITQNPNDTQAINSGAENITKKTVDYAFDPSYLILTIIIGSTVIPVLRLIGFR